jgi:hypothetical protein
MTYVDDIFLAAKRVISQCCKGAPILKSKR